MGAAKKIILPTGFELAEFSKIDLKNHPALNESWLQSIIAEDPSIIGLGELDLLARERRQPQGGKLDLLLSDSSNNRRYEVEVQLGATDESHIVRCIEYWDIERKRYPAYDHVAVLIAEDVTSRFLNIISLMAGNIPIIALQLTTLEVDGKIVLHFTKILNQTTLREDDDPAIRDLEPKDRDYWLKRSSKEAVALTDKTLSLINEVDKTRYSLNYNKYYIGLTDGVRSNNFAIFKPKKLFTHLSIRVSNSEEWVEKLAERGIEAVLHEAGRIRMTFKHHEFDLIKNNLSDLFKEAYNQAR